MIAPTAAFGMSKGVDDLIYAAWFFVFF